MWDIFDWNIKLQFCVCFGVFAGEVSLILTFISRLEPTNDLQFLYFSSPDQILNRKAPIICVCVCVYI